MREIQPIKRANRRSAPRDPALMEKWLAAPVLMCDEITTGYQA